MTTTELAGGSLWAFERIAFSIELTPRVGGAPISDRGHCLWQWQRQSDGGWKIARAIWNSDTPAANSELVEDALAIREVADRYAAAASAGDIEAVMATLSENIVIMPPDGAAVSGAPAVREFFQTQFFDRFHVQLSYSFAELDVRHDRAVAYGPFQLTLTPKAGGAAIRDVGKYIDVYHRQSDGAWKFARVIFNRDRPPAA